MTSTWFKSVAKFVGLCVSALVLALPSGCSTPSLNKAYTNDTLERVSGLEGEWVHIPKSGEEPAFKLVIVAAQDSLYSVDVHALKPGPDEPQKPQHILVGLTTVGGQLFADATANVDREPVLRQYSDYMVLAHVFARVTFDGTTLAVSPLNGGGMDKLVKEKPAAIGHATADDKAVLTAETSDIRAFLAEQKDNQDLFSPEPLRFGRASAAPK